MNSYGYHPWRAAGDLGIDELTCEEWEIDVEEAKTRGLRFDYLRGQPLPRRLAGLVHDLSSTYAVDDLAKMLPWSASRSQDSLELLKLPADLEAGLQEQAARDAAEAPVPVTVVLLGREHKQFEQAMAKVKDELGRGARSGRCLAEICRWQVESAVRERPDMWWYYLRESHSVTGISCPRRQGASK